MAVIWNVLLAHVFRVTVAGIAIVVLGCSVWVIYLWDHVLDARSAKPRNPEPARKAFFRSHSRSTLGLAIAGSLSALLLARTFLNRATLLSGLAICILVGLYFCAVHLLPSGRRSHWPREAAVAFVFTCGVFMPVWVEGRDQQGIIGVSALPFFLLCWVNCCIVETAEWRSLEQDLPSSVRPNLTATWIADHTVLLASIVSVASWGLVAFSQISTSYLIAVLLSTLSFVAISNWFRVQEVAVLCLLADLALCAPLLTFVFL